MNTNWIALVAAPALVAPLLCTGETCMSLEGEPQAGLTRVNAQEPATFDAKAWKDRLLARDLDARERDFEKLVEEARGNDAAHAQLEQWARDEREADLAWTSRLALREARSRNARSPSRWTTPASPAPSNPQWNNLQQRLDDLQSRFGGMDRMFQDLQDEMDRSFGGSGGMRFQPFSPGTGGFQKSQSQGSSIMIGPDGVKVEVTEDVDGKKETRTYTAKTLDELYEAHPELKDKIGAHVDVQTDPKSWWQGQRTAPFDSWNKLRADDADRPARPLQPLQPVTPRTDILGVQVAKTTVEESKQAGIDEGVGLKVGSVEPGTIAARIGIEPGDIVIDVNGKGIHDVEDVRDVLRERKAGEDVSVTIVDDAGKHRVLTWRAGNEDNKKREERKF